MGDFARRLQSPDEDVQRVAESLFEEAKVDEEGTTSDATARQLLQVRSQRATARIAQVHAPPRLKI